MDHLAEALLLGDYRLLSPDTRELFVRTGLIHLLSASGFHMGVAYGLGRLASFLLPWRLRKPPWDSLLELVCAVSLMILLAHTTGWGKPVVRAFGMQTLWLMARALGLRANMTWIFVLSLTLSFHLGRGSFVSFFLSALSMFSLLWARERKKWWIFLCAPWLATLPVTAVLFHSASLFAPVYNFLFCPLFGLFAVLPLIVSLVFSFLGLAVVANFFAGFAAAAADVLRAVLAWFDGVLGGGVSVDFSVLALFLALLPLLFWRSRWRWKYGAAVVALYFFLPDFSLAFLNVGQGDAVVIRGEEVLLVDAGRSDGRVVRELAKARVGELDHLLLTHPDSDHVGGVASVLARMRVGSVWISPAHLEFEKMFSVLEILERFAVPVRFWTVHSPLRELECRAGPGGNANDTSPLCRVRLPGGRRVLLTGDLSAHAEKWFLTRYPSLVRAEVLKAAHHGSKYSSATAFLRAVKPDLAVISAGRGNQYGHPHKEVLRRYRGLGVSVVRTENGAISFFR